MKSILALLAGALLAGTALAQGTAKPPPFTIVVPVEVSNLAPEVTKIGVSCFIWDATATTASDIANGSTELTISRSYRGDVTVPMALRDPSRDPTRATDYRCNLFASAGSPPRSVADGTGVRMPVAAGAPLNLTVSGRLPPK